ncbi:MAG: tetratricopeptide repeat protein [Flavobacteriales bacterium]|nr:tetratricopeptide repeat protein [Flavobacteriales bacterium]
MSRFLHIALIILLTISVSAAFGQRKKKKKEKELSYDDNRKITELFIDANKQKMLGNYEDAAALYHDCIKISADHAASYYELANLLTTSDHVAEALPFAQRAMELDPANEWYALFTANILLGVNDYQSAAKIYEDLTERYPTKVDYRYELATSYLYLNKLQPAIDAYNKIEEQMGVNEEISVQKEKIYLQMDRLDDAVKELEKLIENFPGEQRYLGMLAEVYTANDMLDKAFDVYERMSKNNPEDPILHLNLAEYHRKKKDYEASFIELKKAFASPSLNIDNKIQVMMSYYNLTEGDDKLLSQAYELLDLLTTAHPTDAKAFAMKADFLLRDGRLKESRDSFYETVKLDSSRFMVWSQLINTSYELRDFTAMEADSKVAMELFPNQGSLYLMNGIANNALKDYNQAAAALSVGEVFTRSDTYLNVQLLSVLADVYNNMKQYNESDDAFEKAIKKDPNNPLILNNYSYFLSLRNENLQRAEEMSKKSNLLQPRQASYEDTYAWILYQQGKFESALEWILKAMEHGGSQSGVIIEHYADILYKMGETTKAMEEWKRALELGDHSDELLDKIEGKKLP